MMMIHHHHLKWTMVVSLSFQTSFIGQCLNCLYLCLCFLEQTRLMSW